MSMERAVTVTAKLYRCRDSARFLLGDKYSKTMAEYGGAITEVAARMKCSELEAASTMAGRTEDGMLQMLIFAAYVELSEPSLAKDGA